MRPKTQLAISVGLNTRFSVGNSPAYRILFPASHLKPYERSTEGGLFGSIGFYHLTARQSSTVIEVRFVDFRRLGPFEPAFPSEFLGEAGSFMICCAHFCTNTRLTFIRKMPREVFGNVTSSHPHPLVSPQKGQGTARLDDAQHLGKPRRCNAPLRDAPRSSHAHITRPHRSVDRSRTYRHRPDRRTLV